jgi:hypothetical protein
MEGVLDSDKTKTTATLEMYIFILQKLIRVNKKTSRISQILIHLQP